MRPKIVCASRYTLAEELGAGGMGIVRAAIDWRLGREVAIKTLRSSKRGRRPLERRFLREACVQALLDHPAIVPVYDIGRDGDGALYFSMKRIVGSTLDTARLCERKLLDVFASACRAVHFAHQRGVVHRDLKPANVMLADDGKVYVLDWGVAALVDHPDPEPFAVARALPADVDFDAHTPDGETVGTPGYLSPEQAKSASVDARADIYALGAILFELLALEPLHPRGTTTNILVSTLQGPDARPSVRAPQRAIAPELDAICVRATALDPDDRFQSLAELLGALESFLDASRARERESQRTTDAELDDLAPIPMHGRVRWRTSAALAVVLLLATTACASFAGLGDASRQELSRTHSSRLDRPHQSISIRALTAL